MFEKREWMKPSSFPPSENWEKPPSDLSIQSEASKLWPSWHHKPSQSLGASEVRAQQTGSTAPSTLWVQHTSQPSHSRPADLMSTMTSPSPLRMRWIVGALVVCLLLHAVRVSAEDRRSSPDDISHFMNDSFKDRRGLADDGDKASDQEVDMNINTVHSPSIHTDMNAVYPSNTHRHHSVENLRDASEGLELMDGTYDSGRVNVIGHFKDCTNVMYVYIQFHL